MKANDNCYGGYQFIQLYIFYAKHQQHPISVTFFEGEVHEVSIAVHGLSLVAAGGTTTRLLTSLASLVAEHGLKGTWAQQLRHVEPSQTQGSNLSPTQAGRFLTTGPPFKKNYVSYFVQKATLDESVDERNEGKRKRPLQQSSALTICLAWVTPGLSRRKL